MKNKETKYSLYNKNKYRKNILIGGLIYLIMISLIGVGFSSWAINNTNSDYIKDIDINIGNVTGIYSEYLYIDKDNKPNNGYKPLLYKISDNSFKGFINHNNSSSNDISTNNEGELLFYINFNLKKLKEFDELNVNNSLTFKYQLKLLSDNKNSNNISLFTFTNSKLYEYKDNLLDYSDSNLLSNEINNVTYDINTNTNSVEYSLSLANLLAKDIDILETYLIIKLKPINDKRLTNIYDYLVTNNGYLEFYMDIDKYEETK